MSLQHYFAFRVHDLFPRDAKAMMLYRHEFDPDKSILVDDDVEHPDVRSAILYLDPESGDPFWHYYTGFDLIDLNMVPLITGTDLARHEKVERVVADMEADIKKWLGTKKRDMASYHAVDRRILAERQKRKIGESDLGSGKSSDSAIRSAEQ